MTDIVPTPWREVANGFSGAHCEVCKDPIMIWFYVRDDVWQRVTVATRGKGCWCLMCFHIHAERLGVDYHFRIVRLTGRWLKLTLQDVDPELRSLTANDADIPLKPDFQVPG